VTEHINNSDLLGSGGHAWLWEDRERTQKVIGSAGILGVYSAVTGLHSRSGRIAGKGGGAAVLKATGADKAAADAAMSALELAIESLIDAGTEVDWEDDQGRAGSALVLVRYQRGGCRQYGRTVVGEVPSVAVWQYYQLEVRENYGGWDGANLGD